MLKSNSFRLDPKVIPKSKYKIRHIFLHKDNDPKGTKRFEFCAAGKKPARYVTVCDVIDRATEVVVARGVAICCARDTPSRSQGHSIALGRAVLNFIEQYGHVSEPAPTPPAPVGLRLVHADRNA